MAITTAGLTLALAAMGPAQASPCEASIQTVTRTAGAWSSTSGPIVTVAVDASGVSWTVGAGSQLDHVMLEYAPVETDGATLSAAVALPGAATGVMPVDGDGDLSVRFVGSVCTEQAVSDDTVVDVIEVAVDSADTPEAATVAVEAAKPVVSASTPDATTVVQSVRRLCRFGTYAA